MRWLAATTVLAACYAPDPPAGVRCATGERCPSGLYCIDGLCVTSASDAALRDAPAGDAMPPGADAMLVCPQGYTRIATGACHKAIMEPETWLDAEFRCQQSGGHLVVVDNYAEATTLPEPAWIGASDRVAEGVYRWVTGDALSFTYWGLGEPSGGAFTNCIHTGSGLAQWSDGPCDFMFPSVCEYDGRPAVSTAF
jgi:hypothetical protein